MSVQVFSDVILSNKDVRSDIRGRVMRKNQRITTANGFESINIVWDRSLREYDFGVVPLSPQGWQRLESIFEITEGGAYGFLLLDPKDYRATIDTGRVAAVAGSPSTYQLFKRNLHAASGRYKDRKITRPDGSSITVYVSGVDTTFEIDATTGELTIDGNPSAGAVTWAGQFHVPVHFLNDQIDWNLERAGSDGDTRLFAGPMVTLQEIRE